MGKKTTNSFFPCFSDESLDGGVALNVDFMEELSQAVRLVREDLTLLSKAVRDAAMKLSALLQVGEVGVCHPRKIHHTVDGLEIQRSPVEGKVVCPII